MGWESSLEPTEHEGLKAQQPAHTSRIFFSFAVDSFLLCLLSLGAMSLR